jgi:hypothetical protein
LGIERIDQIGKPVELVELPNLEFLEGDLSFVPQMPKIFELWIDNNPGLSSPLPNGMPNAKTLISMPVMKCVLTGSRKPT